MKVAAVDVGSNSIHMVVVEATGMGELRILDREKVMVRLARGQERTGAISEEAFRAGLEALGRMVGAIQFHGCETVLACGTAALRDASNAQEFVRQAAALGLGIRVISGEEEARLIFQAVAHAVPFPEETVVLMDIGGGSTELTWVQGGKLEASLSIPWGLQRLADAAPTQDPPTAEDLKRLRSHVRKVLRQARKSLPEGLAKPALVLGTSGTLEDLARAGSQSTSLDQAQLRSLHRRLWRASTADRIGKLGVDTKRAEVLHVGATWAEMLMAWLGAETMQHLPVGLREGMVWEALRHGGKAIPALSERRWASVQVLGHRLDPDPVHTHHVQRLAAGLFEDLRPIFELGDQEREWLRMAAELHDIGLSVAQRAHHKLGAYLVRNGGLTGFWPVEVEILSQIVRYHRGKGPNLKRHEGFQSLAPWHRTVVEKLASILRVADALDRSGRRSVLGARLSFAEEGASLLLHAQRPAKGLRRECEALAKKGGLLAKILGLPLSVGLEPSEGEPPTLLLRLEP